MYQQLHLPKKSWSGFDTIDRCVVHAGHSGVCVCVCVCVGFFLTLHRNHCCYAGDKSGEGACILEKDVHDVLFRDLGVPAPW